MAASEIDITVNVEMESLSRDLLEQRERLKELNAKMSTIAATHRHKGAPRVPAQPNEEFSLSELDYEELLETYGSDPVLMTIFNRMKEFFGQVPPEHWVRIKDWSPSEPLKISTEKNWWTDTGTEPFKVRWDKSSLSTTSIVSEPFTVKYDDTGSYSISPNTSSVRYSVEED